MKHFDDYLELLYSLLNNNREFFATKINPDHVLKKLALSILKIVDKATKFSYVHLDQINQLKETDMAFDANEKQMLTDGKTKCDQCLQKIFKICFNFLKFSQDDLDELNENPIDFLDQMKYLAEDKQSNLYRCICSNILTRICEYSDGGMTVIMYACMINLNKNMNLGISKELKKEVGHIESLNELVEVGENPKDILGIVSASLLILTNLNNCWEYRSNILDKVVLFFDFMTEKFKTMDTHSMQDKAIVCLTLVMISKFINILGNLEQSEEEGQ
jgi:hypothetical protein